MTGRIHSLQTLGTLDGPGVRFTVFFQGCPLRCKCCHNPDTWHMSGGSVVSAEEIVTRAVRYREYFGERGGITLTGGEPLLQADFAREIFTLCHKEGINTCLDTSGCVINKSVEKLLDETDRVLLDVKYTNDEQYRENVGCSFLSVMNFLSLLEEKKIPTTLRQVIIPGVNDNEENIRELARIRDSYSTLDSVELLPFRKLCHTKYEKLGLEFPFGGKDEPSAELMEKLNDLLKK